MTELQREVRDQGVLIMKWTSSVIITIIFFFEELFSKIKERLYNFYIIQADYSSQPLSKRGVSTVKPLFSKTPKFTLDISSLTDDNDYSLTNANTATSTLKLQDLRHLRHAITFRKEVRHLRYTITFRKEVRHLRHAITIRREAQSRRAREVVVIVNS